jgi:ABC-type sugar transport system ATPase subunit
VFHNVAYGLEARGVPKAEVRERVTDAAAVLGLSAMLGQSVVDLSGGEQQRVALARALAKDASVYLYDEPLSNLDAKLRHHTRRQIIDIHQRKRKPSLYVTHDQGEALAMANRIGVMAKGRLQQVGTPEQLLDDPQNMFVARFIGSPPMNLIHGQLAMDGDEYLVEADGVRLPLSCTWKPVLDRYAEREVVLGIRPDRMAISSAGVGAISATVADVEPLIGETSVVFHLAGGDSLVGMFVEDMDALALGMPVQIAVQSDGIELFDPETELSLRAG